MAAFKELIDKIFNWSGGAYVGLATLTAIGLAIAQYAAGTPMVVVMPDGKAVVYIVHQAPEWFVGTVGLYTVILALFWAGKPINTWVNAKALPPDPAAPKAGG